MRAIIQRKRLFFLLCFIVGFLMSWFFLTVYAHRYEMVRSRAVQHLIPLYRSLRKIPDVVFMPLTLIHQSNLERFELVVSPNNINRMNQSLPADPFYQSGLLRTENKVWVPAYFKAGDYEGPVKIKYRGNLNNHWNSYKKSYAIQFPKKRLFRGMREMVLVLPDDRQYFGVALHQYRAQKMGLFTLGGDYVRVRLNGAEMGVYYAFEHWSQEWIEKHPISPLSRLYGFEDELGIPGVSALDPRSYFAWKSWNAPDDDKEFEPLRLLMDVLKYSDDKTFAALIPFLVDMHDFYAFETLNILSGDYHGYEGNLILIYDRGKGKFTFVPYNLGLYPRGEGFKYAQASLLRNRILAIPYFRSERDKFIQEYISKNREDDLRYVDKWIEHYRNEFLIDNAKAGNNFSFLLRLNQLRQAVKYRLDTYTLHLDEYGFAEKFITTFTYPKHFKKFFDITLKQVDIARSHEAFVIRNNQLVIPSGQHIFTDTVIIPPGNPLIIDPGAKLFFDPGVSLISYAPVHAKGKSNMPIIVQETSKSEPWGVFAVVNTEIATSTFENVKFSGGGEVDLNGIYFSGMLSLYNANAEIRDSIFSHAHGDDALNVKGGVVSVEHNTFTKNISDAIDFDYPNPQSSIIYNHIINSGGDAIDLSWSNITIRANMIEKCKDKGVSIGERSNSDVYDNLIRTCAIGIAIKDQSSAFVYKNIFEEITNSAISIYQKKSFFGGARAIVGENTFTDVHQKIYVDEVSTYETI